MNDTRPVVARVVAVLFALAGLWGFVVALPDGSPVTQEQIVDALTLLVTASGSVYAALRTWRAKQLATRPPGVPVEPGELTALRREAGAWRGLQRGKGLANAGRVERDPAYDSFSHPVGSGVWYVGPFIALTLASCSQRELTLSGGDTPSVRIAATSVFSNDAPEFVCTVGVDGTAQVGLRGASQPDASAVALLGSVVDRLLGAVAPAGAVPMDRRRGRAGTPPQGVTACTPFAYPAVAQASASPVVWDHTGKLVDQEPDGDGPNDLGMDPEP